MGLATYLIYQQACTLSNTAQVILFQVRAREAAVRQLKGPEGHFISDACERGRRKAIGVLYIGWT